MRTSVAAAVIVAFFVFVQAVDGQGTLSRSWLLYEQGNASFARKEFGEALKLYKDAISVAGIFPEAEMALGDVYKAEGEFDLAQLQYEKAYKVNKAFYIPASRYDVLYKLAYLFEERDLYKLMEDKLLVIVDDDKHFLETPTSQMRAQVERNYLEKGLDHVLLLYGFSDPFAVDAHSKLGWFYYRSGRYAQAVSHLLYSTINRISRLNGYLKDGDPDYQFSSLQDTLSAVQKVPEMKSFVANSDLYKDLYYLAGSTFANGYPEHALTLWRLIAGFPEAGIYQGLSRKQLKKPSIEPLLGATVRPLEKSGN
jgi:tetratricopeptide (TPR) repeat protein